MTDVGNYGQVHRMRIQRASGGGSSHATAVAVAGVLGDLAGFLGGTSGVSLRNSLCQGGHKFAVFLLACNCRAGAGNGAGRRVGCAFVLGPGQGVFGHQETLPLVAFVPPVESHHYRRERTMFVRPPRQRRVARR